MTATKNIVPDIELAREFRQCPLGLHSPGLQRLVRMFRSEPVAGKYGLLRIKPERVWILVQFSGRKGEPLIEHPDRQFDDWAEAEWAVFKLRWHRHFGEELSIE